MIPSITARVLPSGDLEEVVRGEHLGKTTVVRDHSRDNAEVSSSFLNVQLPHQEACVLMFSKELIP